MVQVATVDLQIQVLENLNRKKGLVCVTQLLFLHLAFTRYTLYVCTFTRLALLFTFYVVVVVTLQLRYLRWFTHTPRFDLLLPRWLLLLRCWFSLNRLHHPTTRLITTHLFTLRLPFTVRWLRFTVPYPVTCRWFTLYHTLPTLRWTLRCCCYVDWLLPFADYVLLIVLFWFVGDLLVHRFRGHILLTLYGL